MKSKFHYLKRIIINKLPYPLHLNLAALYAWLFGSLRLKVLYDTFRIPHYAYGIYEAASRAKSLGQEGITVIEFGVANGRGLMAMVLYAEKVAKAFNIQINLLGFDSGEGMPNFLDYRDHPELYTGGDFPMIHRDELIRRLPANAKLVLLNLNNDSWVKAAEIKYPIGFISIDVDYYSSTVSILQHLKDIDSNLLLPNVIMYFDDVLMDNHNAWQGERLAIQEFNHASPSRKIDQFTETLRNNRMLKHATWLTNMYQLHPFDHHYRKNPYRKGDAPVAILHNKYLG